jgi:hypothetical protein
MNVSLATQTTLEFKPLTQTEQILEYLTNPVGARISTWIAYEKFHCTCLAQRIYDLKKSALIFNVKDIFKICEETVNKNGKHFSEYWLERIS